MNLDIDCLRSFLVVADSMSFSRAAETVGRSQSTISQQIAKLETQTGRPLLSRRKGRVLQLTSEGERLMQYARRILQLNDEAYASMSDDLLTGFVRLGVPLDFFGRDFTVWLARFKARHPMVGLEVEANQSENLQKRSARGDFDLAFFKQESGATLGTVAQREQLVWVGGPKLAAEDLDSTPLVLFPEGCTYRSCAIRSLKEQKRPWHVSFVSPSFECLKTATVEGMGVTVLARALVAPPLKIIRHGKHLPQLPAVELAYSSGRRGNSRVVSELANYLADRLAMAGSQQVAAIA
ncbi:LysR family transcriptional regulator [Bradyrhizobium sp. 139]|uniref:LysR substrate-binding domain-containing protein n=1 Tax=Bradyrhizobium sp. 139 TaxID=2782616 RepID=UPI001FF9AC22|nr:LysR family transcriptional regulator [Bradyrhizobium sp. 139]